MLTCLVKWGGGGVLPQVKQSCRGVLSLQLRCTSHDNVTFFGLLLRPAVLSICPVPPHPMWFHLLPLMCSSHAKVASHSQLRQSHQGSLDLPLCITVTPKSIRCLMQQFRYEPCGLVFIIYHNLRITGINTSNNNPCCYHSFFRFLEKKKRRVFEPWLLIKNAACTEMEFLDINLTKNSSLSLYAIHSPLYWRILMKTKFYSCFKHTQNKKTRVQHFVEGENGGRNLTKSQV